MSAMTLPTDEGRRTVRLYGQGWCVRRALYGLIGLAGARSPPIGPARSRPPAPARPSAAPPPGAPDEIEARP